MSEQTNDQQTNDRAASQLIRLLEDLDKHIASYLFKAGIALLCFLVRPFAAATEPFFRKNLGERYFSGYSLTLGLAVWGTFVYLAIIYNSKMEAWCAGSVAGAFAVLGANQLSLARQRTLRGQPWHSLSRGESLFGIENWFTNLLIALLFSLILGLGFKGLGAAFFASQCLCHLLAAYENRRLYLRYLDAVDAQIEVQHMEQSLKSHTPPLTTAGLYRPLPSRFTGELRAHIARIATQGPIPAKSPVLPAPYQPEPKPKLRDNPGNWIMLTAIPAIRGFLKKGWCKSTGWAAPQFKQHWRVIAKIAVLIALAVVIVHYAYPWCETHVFNKMFASKPTANAPTSQITPAIQTPPASVTVPLDSSPVAAQEPNSNPVQHSELETKAQPVLLEPKIVNTPPTPDPRALRAAEIETFRAELARMTSEFSNFHSYAENNFWLLSNQIKSVKFFKRVGVRNRFEEVRFSLDKFYNGQQQILAAIATDLRTVEARPRADLTEFRRQFSQCVEVLNNDRATSTNLLDELASRIREAGGTVISPGQVLSPSF